jgi:hypothetical protein
MFLAIRAGLKQLGLFENVTDEDALKQIRENAAKSINQEYISIGIITILNDIKKPISMKKVRDNALEIPQSFINTKIHENWENYSNEEKEQEVENLKTHIKTPRTYGTTSMLGGICLNYNVDILLLTNTMAIPNFMCNTEVPAPMGVILLYHTGGTHFQQGYFRLREGDNDSSNLDYYKSGVKSDSLGDDVHKQYIADRTKDYGDLKNKMT